MKLALLILLGVMAIAPFAGATDWLSWRKVGDATLTRGPFTIYNSQLRTPDGRYRGLKEDQALIITYQRNIERQELVDATREQWRAQGILAREAQSESRFACWVSYGLTLRRVRNWFLSSVISRGNFGIACQWHKGISSRLAHHSRRRSAKTFSLSGWVPVRNILSCGSSSLEVINETFISPKLTADDATFWL